VYVDISWYTFLMSGFQYKGGALSYEEAEKVRNACMEYLRTKMATKSNMLQQRLKQVCDRSDGARCSHVLSVGNGRVVEETGCLPQSAQRR